MITRFRGVAIDIFKFDFTLTIIMGFSPDRSDLGTRIHRLSTANQSNVRVLFVSI